MKYNIPDEINSVQITLRLSDNCPDGTITFLTQIYYLQLLLALVSARKIKIYSVRILSPNPGENGKEIEEKKSHFPPVNPWQLFSLPP